MLLEALDSAPRDLARMLRPLTAEKTLRSIRNGWSIAQVAGHMALNEAPARARFERVVWEADPRVILIDAGAPEGDDRTTAGEWLARFADARAKTIDFLGTVTHQQWLRQCTHETLGVAKLHQLVRMLIAHDSEHLAQIAVLREEITDSP